MMHIWHSIFEELELNNTVVLLVVLDSHGSSPGRKGFKMMVSASGNLVGSIGGGIMEHKLVELAKKELEREKWPPFFKLQVHKDNLVENKSGMICSGNQRIGFYYLGEEEVELIEEIGNAENGVITFDTQKISFDDSLIMNQRFKFVDETESWELTESLDFRDELHIIGGGHVSLALSKLSRQIGFKIYTYDDRKNLNTVEANKDSKHIYIDDYNTIGTKISSGKEKYVVLMSFGYRTDKIILKELIEKEFRYLGMMGSKEKVKRLFSQLKMEGITEEQLNAIHSPIGIQINSRTPEEISISILAELIKVKNSK